MTKLSIAAKAAERMALDLDFQTDEVDADELRRAYEAAAPAIGSLGNDLAAVEAYAAAAHRRAASSAAEVRACPFGRRSKAYGDADRKRRLSLRAADYADLFLKYAREVAREEPPAAWDDFVSDEVLCRLARQQLRAADAVASALAAVAGSAETNVIVTLAAAVGDLSHSPLANMRGGLATHDIGVVMDCRYLAAGLAEHVARALEAMDRRCSTDVRPQLDGLTEARADLKDILEAALWAGRADGGRCETLAENSVLHAGRGAQE